MGDEVIRTRPNACIISEPNHPRWFYFAEDTRMNWLHAYVDIQDLLEKYDIPVNCVLYPSSADFIADIFRRMTLERFSGDHLGQDMLDSYAKILLIKLSRSIHTNTKIEVSGAEQERMYRIRLKILSKPEKKWTVAEMSELACLSQSRFHAVYKSMFGISPMKEVIRAKIEHATVALLTDEKLTLPEMAEQLGYKNQQHFISQFKSVTGMTPGAYRKANR